MFKQMPLILSILATTSSAQLANAPERVREAKNDAIASSNSEFGRRSPSVNLRKNGRVLQQTMSMEMETDVGELAYDPNDPDLVDCDIGNQDICAPGEECLIPGLGLLCNPIATVPFFCEGKCVRVPPPLIAGGAICVFDDEDGVYYPVCEENGDEEYCTGSNQECGRPLCACDAAKAWCDGDEENPCDDDQTPGDGYTCVPEDEIEHYPVCEGNDPEDYCDGDGDCVPSRDPEPSCAGCAAVEAFCTTGVNPCEHFLRF